MELVDVFMQGRPTKKDDEWYFIPIGVSAFALKWKNREEEETT